MKATLRLDSIVNNIAVVTVLKDGAEIKGGPFNMVVGDSIELNIPAV